MREKSIRYTVSESWNFEAIIIRQLIDEETVRVQVGEKGLGSFCSEKVQYQRSNLSRPQYIIMPSCAEICNAGETNYQLARLQPLKKIVLIYFLKLRPG